MMRRVLALAVVVICGMGLPALAGEGYVGASYMDSTAEIDSSSDDASASGWKVFGGYNLIKYFGVELTYYDLGSFDAGANSSTTVDVQVFDLAGRGILPLGKRFELFARLGYSNVGVDVSSPLGSSDTTDWELLYGIGAGVKLGKRFGIRAEWESWDVETSLDAWSVGAFVRFGGQ